MVKELLTFTELEDLLVKAVHEREQLRVLVVELKHEVKALGLLAAEQERDKEYNAELIRERDAEIEKLRGGFDDGYNYAVRKINKEPG